MRYSNALFTVARDRVDNRGRAVAPVRYTRRYELVVPNFWQRCEWRARLHRSAVRLATTGSSSARDVILLPGR
jgi:hypothetical protein